ncbi:MAG: cell division protein FtsZ [Oxalobacter sp.]|nr:cell division protein FtsZ [Oxalobacter sp.]
MEFDMVEDNINLGTVIKVVGVGGAGGNAVQHMINKGVSGVEFIAANTDSQALSHSSADNIIQIGDSGLGAGMRPDIGRKLAEESRSRIEDALRGAHMVFIAAGMGGGTGTGASPVIAEVAKSLGALTVAVVSKPFSYEGAKCMEMAEAGLEQLGQHVDSLIVILNEKLEEIYEDDSMVEWFQHADDVLNNAVAGIAEIINVRGHINVDFNDVKTIMAEQGKAMMGTAVATGSDRAVTAAQEAVSSPLLDGINLSGARGVLVNVTASKSLKGKEIRQVMAVVREFASPEATIVQGVAFDDSMGDDLRVTVVATGLDKPSVTKPVKQAEAPAAAAEAPAAAEAASQPEAAAEKPAEVPEVEIGWKSAGDVVQQLKEGGMDTYDIPAFLRNQMK